jgi:hypothetical protein
LLIFLLFAVLLVIKLAAIGLVTQFGAIVALPIIAACLIIARCIDPTAATPRRPRAR